MVVKTEITTGTFDPRNYKVECQSYCYTVILHTGSDHETLEISKTKKLNLKNEKDGAVPSFKLI